MPIYEHFCYSCGLQFEKYQNSSRRNRYNCPDCKSNDTHRLISTSALRITEVDRMTGDTVTDLDWDRMPKNEIDKRVQDRVLTKRMDRKEARERRKSKLDDKGLKDLSEGERKRRPKIDAAGAGAKVRRKGGMV